MRRFGFLLTLLFAIAPFAGCSDDVAEVETPSGEIEVEEELGGGLETEYED